MALLSSLTSGVSALKSFTRGIEVIGDNIANVNTTAFKTSRVAYTDSFSTLLQQSTSSGGGNAVGSNQASSQVGTGVQIGSVSTKFTQGQLVTTGVTTDLAIVGEGFFVVKDTINNTEFATRNGNLRLDDRGYVVNSQGFRLQGLAGGSISYDVTAVPSAPDTFAGLSTALTDGDLTITVGAAAPVTVSYTAGETRDSIFAKISAATSADLTAAYDETADQVNFTNNHATDAIVIVDANGGNLLAATGLTSPIAAGVTASSTAGLGLSTSPKELIYTLQSPVSASTVGDVRVNFNLSVGNGLTNSTGGAFTDAEVAATSPSLVGMDINNLGNISLSLSNGDSFIIGRVLLTNFNDPQSLVREGNGLYSGFDAAGVLSGGVLGVSTNAPGGNGLGIIQSEALEQSNVDLTEEFVNMITTQRSFQAGARLVTVSDDILQEIVNLKR